MKVRGRRECTQCGTRWSYYETGEVTCPNCGSLRSRGVDERTRHTDHPVTLDLTAARAAADDDLLEAASAAAERCREYVRRTGFINEGRLKPLSDTYLAATELVHVAGDLRRAMRVTDDEELYLLALLRGADLDDRPAPSDVPDSLRAARGLAYAAAVEAYRGDVRTHLDDHPDELAGRVLGRLRDQAKRVEALDGEVSTATSERLARAAQDLGAYLIDGDEDALAAAEERLDAVT
ncbi:TFIIB-type zinc ribbon-containing protein [Halomarina halobia]|uniref:TFIIB-type zinc ribbon-containing protein n=1 Tax=Halomarina halobia TaxID=3033386 RepID=A0ABD6A3S5_9EURY|nr:TFIIB-type zinc ribbon-containing protein [Halomarina sp. PSR21]